MLGVQGYRTGIDQRFRGWSLIMEELQSFYEQLQAEVIAEAQAGSDGLDQREGAGDFKECAFTRVLLDDLEAAGLLESPVECFDAEGSGNTSIKVNGYSIPDEEMRLDLVISAYFVDPSPRRVAGADTDRYFNQALRYFRAAVSGHHEQLEPGSGRYSMAREIFARKEEFDRVQIVLITNGLVVQRKERERKPAIDKWRMSYDVWDVERLRRFRSSGATHEPVTVDLTDFGGIPCSVVSDKALGYETCVAILPGTVLHDWYDEFGAQLLELNVRSYLQARGKVNKGILETIIKEPQRFLSYNNGITIVAESLGLNEAGDRISSIRGIQIVNGGQTTASIHRAKKENKADLSHVFVQAKLTVVPSDQFESVVPEISRYSNTQNKVSEVDLGANHAFHVGIERAARATWAPGEQSMWFYERARGGYQTERTRAGNTSAARARFDTKYPVSQRISKEELGRYWNAWGGFPHFVSKGGQKNFTRFMETIPRVEKGWLPSRAEYESIIGKAIFFRAAQRIAKEIDVPAYRINVVTYTVALIVEKTASRIDLLDIWARQEIPSELEALIRDWLPKVGRLLLSAAGERNPTDWFKLESCWKQLRDDTKDWKISEDVTGVLSKAGLDHVNGSSGAMDSEVQNNIARCMQVDGPTWFKISLWGKETGLLQFWQTGIANTLAGYAVGSWLKKPSEKQANHGAKILELYRDNNPGA
jgi:hypothetical protein